MSGHAARNETSRNVDPPGMVDFVNLALSQNDRTGICTILHEIAEVTHSSGAILWELDPDIPFHHPDARLFTAGHWFRSGRRFAEHDLPVYQSFMGWVLIAKKTGFTNSVATDERCSHSPVARKLYEKHNIGKFLAAPVCFIDGPPGVLTLFRSPDEPDFQKDDEPLLEVFCSLLPGLHDSLHHKVSFKLIDQIKNILQGADDSLADLSGFWQQICDAVRDCFHLLEASLFLEDRDHEAGEFRLAATTYEEYAFRKVYKAGEVGKTSWAITNCKPLRIWDLKHRKDPKEKAIIGGVHGEISWGDEDLEIEQVATAEMRLPEKAIPPLSFIAQPVFSSGKTLCGILRCCAAKEAPYYFTHRERALLEVIASQIGQFWAKWLDRRTVRDENLAWSRVVQSMNTLNYGVRRELRKHSPDVQNVLRKGLDEVTALLPDWEIADIRLFDDDTGELYFSHVLPADNTFWTEEKKALRFPADKKPAPTAGARVYQSRQMEVIQHIEQDFKEAIFKDAKSMIIAPILYGDKCYGILDLRNVKSRQLPSYAEQMAELFGRQLGLSYGLIDAQKRLKEQAEFTAQAFADWQHQIRGPINQAHFRLHRVLRSQFPDYMKIPTYLKVQIGLLTKAKRASQGLHLFLELAGEERIRIKPNPMDPSDVGKLMMETCVDNQTLGHNQRQVNFHVDLPSFHALQPHSFFADLDLLEQAVNNIIDNAFKYSYRQTEIRVSASDSGQHFCVAVSNDGIPIKHADIHKLTTRGWRTESAKSVQGEGTGIGLWVVDHIMKAHDGRLEILPTSLSSGRTEVRLLFPWLR